MYLRKEKTASSSQSWKSLWILKFQLLKIPSTWWSKTSEIKLPYHLTCKKIRVQKLKRNIPSPPIMPKYMITLSNHECLMLRSSLMRSSESLIKFHWFHFFTNNIWNELIIFIMLGEAIFFYYTLIIIGQFWMALPPFSWNCWSVSWNAILNNGLMKFLWCSVPPWCVCVRARSCVCV